MKRIFLSGVSVACLFGASMLQAQSFNTSASHSWNSSYGSSSALERNTRLGFVVEQNKLKNGFYGPANTTVYSTTTNTYSYDHSISNSVNAAAGAAVDLENRSAEGSGTSSNVIGAVNTSTNNINTNGSGHSIDIANAANSDAGCIDGGITSSSNRPVGAIDISAGTSVSGAGGSSFSVSPKNCSR